MTANKAVTCALVRASLAAHWLGKLYESMSEEDLSVDLHK